MDDQQQAALRALLTGTRVLSLSVMVEEAPYAGLLPYALAQDFSEFLIHASGLARHTGGLYEGAPFGLVIHAPDGPDTDPMQLPRVVLQGRVRLIEPDDPAHAPARERYVARFPQSEMTFGLGDFSLFALVPERGRFITGFAGAHNIGPRTLASLAD